MDWEYCFAVTSEIYGVSMIMLAAYVYFWLVSDFVREKSTARLTGIVYMLSMLVLNYMPFYISSYAAYLIGALSGLLVMCLAERENFLQKIFLAEIFYAVRWLMMRMVSSAGALIFKVDIHFRKRPLDMRLDYFLYLAITILEMLIGSGLMITAALLIRKAYRDKTKRMQGQEFVLLSAPSLVVMMSYINYKYLDDTLASLQFSTFDASFYYHGVTLLLCMSMYIMIVIVIVLFQNIKEKREEEARKELLAGQMADMKRHIHEVEELYQEIRSLKHDMGNHVMVMQSLAGREREQYAESLKEQYCAVAEGIQSGNPVTDVILMERSREAQSKGIDFNCSFRYPAGRDVDAFDLSIILNNALANAIEAACGEGKKSGAEKDNRADNAPYGEESEKEGAGYIKITSSLRENVYMIEVENSYSHRICMDKESNLPVTTKEDKLFHGFGLRNIRRVAQKYHGDIEVEAAEVFRLSVMLQACEIV